ncbi:unnamed protein product [Eruca vesicaria subsp. sativa]|uniref:Uncharacterized protein n=1 Tax=Eruca vesicaria subsp. sativa TaxID=29727 RepID=A0ABC8KGU9_ERUVS|nr:unnamed protein product [Eruca vesicaria subsp. sativa]
MNDLLNITFKYTNCPDPAESAARVQRVINEDPGLMEETATGIIAAAQRNLAREMDASFPISALAATLPPAPHKSSSSLSVRRSTGKSARHKRNSSRLQPLQGSYVQHRTFSTNTYTSLSNCTPIILSTCTPTFPVNMVGKESKGFDKKLILVGVSYHATVEGKDLVMNLGFLTRLRSDTRESQG